MTGVAAPVKSIGVPHPLIDGPDKVTGSALYAGDFAAAGALVVQPLSADAPGSGPPLGSGASATAT